MDISASKLINQCYDLILRALPKANDGYYLQSPSGHRKYLDLPYALEGGNFVELT